MDLNVNYPSLVGVFLTLSWNFISCQGYVLGMTNVTWSAARDLCAGQGSNLYMQTQIGHWGDLNAAVNLSVTSSFWIGLSRPTDTSPFQWMDGSTFTTDYWSTGEPNNSATGMNCVEARVLDGKWETAQCSDTMQYVCQHADPVVVTMKQPTRPQMKRDHAAVMMEGLLRGFGLAGGMILIVVVIIHLPCCRNWVTKKENDIGRMEKRNMNVNNPRLEPVINQGFQQGY